MTFPPGANLYTQGFGSRPENIEIPFIAQRAPTANDVNFPIGKVWIDSSGDQTYTLTSQTSIGGVLQSNWSSGGNNPATTTDYGLVLLTDNSEPVATKTYADALAIAGSPVATTTTSGIGKLVSDANAVARIASSGVQAYFVQPSNLTAVMSSPGPIGDTVASTGAFTGLTTDGTAAVSLACTGASNITCATGDLTIADTASSVVITAGEAVDDAIQLTAAAGGLAATFAKSAVITSTEANADSVQLTSAGGMQLTATGAAGKDLTLTCTSGSMSFTAGENIADSMVFTNKGFQVLTTGAAAQDITLSNTGGSITLVATENAAQNIYLHANGGASETIQLRADQGTGDASVQLLSDVGGVTLTGGKAAATAINFTTSDVAGGITMTAGTGGILPSTTGKYTVISTANAAQAIELHANGGVTETIRIRSDQGTSATSLDLLSDVGGITLNGGLASASAINITSSDAAGGWTLNSGTGGVTLTNTGILSLAGSGASNITIATGDFTITDTASSIILSAGEAVADAIQITASDVAGGIAITSGTGGVALTNTGALSLAGSGASNITIATGDLSLIDTASSIIIDAGEAVADAIQLTTSNAAGGITATTGTGGFNLTNTGALSLAGSAASNVTISAGDLTLEASTNSVVITAAEAVADAIKINASAGGAQLLAGGGAGLDTLITNTNGSMTLTAGENVTDAMNITASGAASRINLTAGTGSIKFASGLIVPVTNLTNADTPYTVLGTDYFLSCDTSGGVLTVTLPNAATVAGRTYVIRDSGGAAAVSNITIASAGGNLVGGGAAAATKTLSANYSGATVYSNGTTWNYAYVA